MYVFVERTGVLYVQVCCTYGCVVRTGLLHHRCVVRTGLLYVQVCCVLSVTDFMTAVAVDRCTG